jgi:hypothetical protein
MIIKRLIISVLSCQSNDCSTILPATKNQCIPMVGEPFFTVSLQVDIIIAFRLLLWINEYLADASFIVT